MSIHNSQCTWPSMLQNSTWLDSDKGTLTFSDTTMTGWTIIDGRTGSQVISDWECFYQIDYLTYSIVIYKATSTVTFLEGTFRVFICMKLTEITSNSFYYYQQSAPDSNYYDTERITVKKESDIAAITSTDAESSLCVSDSVNGPSDIEYHVLVKQGMETDVIQTCDPSFFGRYWYTVSSDDTTWGCNETSLWDVCTDKSVIAFDYSQCPTVIAESSSGEVGCLFSLSTSSYTLQTVLTTSNTSHNFTCILSSLDDVTGKVNASLAPGSCKREQTPNTVPSTIHADGSSKKTGQIVQLTPNAEAITTTTPVTTTQDPGTPVETAAIIGGVLGSLALTALVVLLVIACKSWKLGKVCLSRKEETEKPGLKVKPLGKGCFCWKEGTRKEDKAKLKKEMVTESLPHKRIPHFIHEQPAMAPTMTALDHEESSIVNKSPKSSSLSPRSPKVVPNKSKLRKVRITPVATQDISGKSSQASMSTVNSVKSRNLSSVNLSLGNGDNASPFPISRNSVVSDPLLLTARSADRLNESFNSESIGRVSSLSKYLNSTQDTIINSEVDTLDETVSMSDIRDGTRSQELVHTKTTLDLKHILPISASESFAYESKQVRDHTSGGLASSHRTAGLIGIKKYKDESSPQQYISTKRLSTSAPPMDDKLKTPDKVTYKRLSKGTTVKAEPTVNKGLNSKSPSSSLNTKTSASSQWTTIDERTFTTQSLLSESRSSDKSSLKRRRHSKTGKHANDSKIEVESQMSSSSQWTTVDERTLSGSANTSRSSKSAKPTYKRYRNSNLSTPSKDSSRNFNSKNTDSSQWTTMDEETITNSTVLSKTSTPISAYQPPHHRNSLPTDTHRIGSSKSRRSDTYSRLSAENGVNRLCMKPNNSVEKPVAELSQGRNTQVANAQGTQTDISSLEVYFQAHGYPEQVYPKSVKTGLYYISDSPLTPIAEANEQKPTKQRTKQNEMFEGYSKDDPVTCMKLYSENTFSTQWETVDEETVTESDSTDDSDDPMPERLKRETTLHANIVKPIGAADTSIPFQRIRTYNGYEPDSD